MKRFQYETCCVEANGDDITAMVDRARQVSLATIRRHCDIADFERAHQYTRSKRQGLTLARDWHVSYSKSKYQGRRCYYIVQSGIEYIFTERAAPNRVRVRGQ